jgi:Ras-related protein Rab-2A
MEPPLPPPPLRINLLVLGPPGCGKSALVKRLVEGRFAARPAPTIGVDFGVWAAPPLAAPPAPAAAAGRAPRLQFFDLGGAEAYLGVRVEFYRAEAGAHGALLCFDAGDRASFEALGAWLAEARAGGLAAAPGAAADAPPQPLQPPPQPQQLQQPQQLHSQPPPVVLCACKTEALPRAVPAEEARAWAEREGLAAFVETSASLGTGHAEAFALLAALASERALAAEARETRGLAR